MPAITLNQAKAVLTKTVEDKLDPYELLEVYNELFPDDRYTEEQAEDDSWPLIEQLVEHIDSGLSAEEIVELWGLILPEHRNVWYDEEAERVHYTEESEPQHAE